MTLVKFKDGTYGVRRGWFEYEYLDLKSTHNRLWWKQGSVYMKDCRSYEGEAKKWYDLLTDTGTPVRR